MILFLGFAGIVIIITLLVSSMTSETVQQQPPSPHSNVLSCPHSEPYVIIDTETTGLDPRTDKLLQISAIRYDTTGTPIDFFNTYINPGIHIPSRITQINGITDKMVANAPKVKAVQESFLSFVGDSLIIGYNTKFDLKFLNQAFDCTFSSRQYVDVLEMSRQLLSLPQYKLSYVAGELGFTPRASFHNSFVDCEAVAAILHRIGDDLEFWTREFSISTYQQTPFSADQNIHISPDQAAFYKAYELWSQGEHERICGNFETAFQLFEKARAEGYKQPAIFDSYAKAYRKLKDYKKEIEILEEAISLFHGDDAEYFAYRKKRAEELMNVSKKREDEQLQRQLRKEQREERRRREREEKEHISKKPRGRAIIQYSDDGTILKKFDSISSAEKEIGVSSKSIRDAANGRQKHAGGFCWKYAELDVSDSDTN